ncbi:MAG: hypothetical protein CL678_08935 [Bdellovibrionaceae bacterium]|nr:hypothetical protein [Pseudobdellovibrionaceae bacterium]|tara:strand:+ start:628 stop:2337 length:1710 start_codon:yes stop_codon:yes gene_type:complete
MGEKIRLVLLGMLAGVITNLPEVLWTIYPGIGWSHPIVLAGVLTFFLLVSFGLIQKESTGRAVFQYSGLSNLLVHIHSPPNTDSSQRWLWRALHSALLHLFGGVAGSEGAAIEAVQGVSVRSRSGVSQWFEGRRRTDAAVALASGVTGAMGAPIAGILLASEVGLGGGFLFITMGVLGAILSTHLIHFYFAIPPIYVESSLDWMNMNILLGQNWKVMGALIVISPLLSIGIRGLSHWCNDSFGHFFPQKDRRRFLVATLFLVLILLAFPKAHVPPEMFFRQFLEKPSDLNFLSLSLLSKGLSVVLLLGVFGSIGTLWPVFLIGAISGLICGTIFGQQDPVWAVLGGAFLFSLFFGAPLASVFLIFEWTHNIPLAFVSALMIYFLQSIHQKLFGNGNWISDCLSKKGFSISQGRSVEVLSSISVNRAMAVDFQSVRPSDNLEKIYESLSLSSYPFIPVVDDQGSYIGILSADIIEEAWEEAHFDSSDHKEKGVTVLLEAKDLLYRNEIHVPFVQSQMSLMDVQGKFKGSPVLVVLSEDRRIEGILFDFQVRIAYEREVARVSLFLRRLSN